MRGLVCIAAAALLAATAASAQEAEAPAAYESLVLSLSWSPTWCATRPGHADHEQCGDKKYAFVVHGLWPQYERGVKHRRKCLTATEVPAKVADQMLPVMPSHKLIEHEWETHGACVEKDPATYYAKAKTAYERIKIPAAFRSAEQPRSMTADQIRKAFVDANPGLPEDAVAVACHTSRPRRGGEPAAESSPPAAAPLNDVRFCLDKALKFQECPGTVRDRCPDTVLVPAAAK